jgi:hypothetical protein
MSQPELVAAVTGVLGTVVTTHQPEDLPRVALSIVIDPYTPFPKPKFHAPSPKTLPQGFVESVLQTEQARRPFGTTSPAGSPTAKSASVPALQATSTDPTDKRGLRNIFNLSVAIHGASSASPTNSNTAASSVSGSLAGSRASSPRGSREFSPRPSLQGFIPSPLSYGVAFEDEPTPNTHRISFRENVSALGGGSRSPVHAVSEGPVDLFPVTQIKTKGETRGRRRTYDAPTGQVTTSPAHKSARIFSGNKGAAVTLSAMLGLSSASKRVVPAAGAEHEPR